MFGLHDHVIEDASPMPNPSRFSFGATDLHEDDLEANWPATQMYHDLYTQDLASSLAQSPMSDAYRIDVLAWDPKVRLIELELLLEQPGVWEAYLSDLNSMATSHPNVDLEDT
ncbi:hypothetical protein L198_07406 [Cryptococcus wingfieldii CBS 7118]|uniref:Uncharacterized protein n=1 Tax=Cryptococcus wingfieldii CBS 7118 TaxID=1295528 RepID=A0A1E3IBY7_9TREE|nr:hypothetical protein L198_08166 [Cryptococcus wingfieldii CBS 7118]XP_019028656.1 hypothetical protein L198_07406 [Cryptococcus wingfieldii CBS 7118]ODN74980.1 hypothetical protein L198_08166 [Cryptococcus wingfieldii CBS 7118]ODN86113.1 hypothetical protein L198_07406 [Cryptococcus wingfieldii CBS 7118]